MMLQPTKYFADLCKHLGLDHLPDDERLQSAEGFVTHADEVGREVAAAIAAKPFAYWVEQLQTLEGPWAPAKNPTELAVDAQLEANGCFLPVVDADGIDRKLVANPVQFDETPPSVTRGPLFAEHTEDILRELGKSDDDISRTQDRRRLHLTRGDGWHSARRIAVTGAAALRLGRVLERDSLQQSSKFARRSIAAAIGTGRAGEPRRERAAIRHEKLTAPRRKQLSSGLLEAPALGHGFGQVRDVGLLPVVHAAAQGRRRRHGLLVEHERLPPLLVAGRERDERRHAWRRRR